MRMEASGKEKKWSRDGEIEKNSDTRNNTMTGGVNIRAVVTKRRAIVQLHQGTHHVH